MPDGRSNWQTTFPGGRNDNDLGKTLDGFLLESAVVLFEKGDPLFEGVLAEEGVARLHLRFSRNASRPIRHRRAGQHPLLSDALEDVYAGTPASYMIFGRARW